MKRAFLVLLVLFLILVTAAVQHAAYASPFGEEKLLGMVPYFDLRYSLPRGIFLAGEIVVGLGMGAQLLLSYARATEQFTGVGARSVALQSASLWCGWTTLSCCLPALFLIFPPDPQVDAETLKLTLPCGAGLALLCYFLNFYLKGKADITPGLITAALAVAATVLWDAAGGEIVLPAAASGILMLLEPWHKAGRATRAAVCALILILLAVAGAFMAETGEDCGGGAVLLTCLVTLSCLAGLSCMRLGGQ